MSNYTITTNVEQIDKKQWSNFIENSLYGNIFQTYDYYQVINNTNHFSPISIFVLENNLFIKGVLIGSLIKTNKGLVGYFSSRIIIWGAPIVENDNPIILNLLLETLIKKFYNKAIYIQFRNLFDNSNYKNIFKKHGFKYKDHLNILIDLSQDWGIISKNIKKSRRRNYTKAKNKGVSFYLLNTPEEVRYAYLLIKETYRRIKLPVPDFSHYEELFKHLFKKKYVHFFAAKIDDKIIGTRIVFTYKNVIFDYYAGSSYQYKKYYPNDFLILSILKWGNEKGYSIFDFGGAGNPDKPYRVRDYKLQFSNNIINYGRFEKINKPVLYKIGYISLKFVRFFNKF